MPEKCYIITELAQGRVIPEGKMGKRKTAVVKGREPLPERKSVSLAYVFKKSSAFPAQLPTIVTEPAL